MPIKDKVVNWFIQNVLAPKKEIIDKPGFVVTTFTEENQVTYLRELFLPEKLLEDLENNVINKYGDKGKQTLYSAGKKFGYLYAQLSNFPTIKDYSEKDMSNFISLLVKYMETTFSKNADYKTNFDEKTLFLSFEDYVVCRHNGYGYILTEGGSAGLWSYLMQDKSIEAIQLECEGRENDKCNILCESSDKLIEKIDERFYKELELPEKRLNESYKAMNEIRPSSYSNNSMKDLINSNFFRYEGGSFFYNGNRFFGCESHILYLLEKEISKLEEGEKIIFETCFEYGKTLRRTYSDTDYSGFLTDFFPAIGFGDITVLSQKEPTVASIYYPWTRFSEESNFIIFRGILSGFVSDATGEKVIFDTYETDINNYLTLTIKSNSKN
ncbi:MAG: hypothetical protein V5A64_06930 [Candidatus Thermoplasmatota archaeon]